MEGTNLCICGFLSTEIPDEKDRADPYSTVWQLQIECGKKEKLTRTFQIALSNVDFFLEN